MATLLPTRLRCVQSLWIKEALSVTELKFMKTGYGRPASAVLRACVNGASGKHICFPPCLNRCRHRARLQSQRAFRRSWPRPESWPPASSGPPLSSGWRRSRSTPRSWGGSGRRIRPRRKPDGRETHEAFRGCKRKLRVTSFSSCPVYKDVNIQMR